MQERRARSSRTKPSRASATRARRARPRARVAKRRGPPRARRGARGRRPSRRRRGMPASRRRAKSISELLHRRRACRVGHREEAVEHRRSPRPARATSRKPPPAGPVSGPSATNAAKAAARQRVDRVAALGEDVRPASAVSGWPAAIAPRIGRGYAVLSARPSSRAGASLAGARGRSGSSGSSERPWSAPALERRARGAAAGAAEPGRDDRHPHLAGQPRVDGGAEDDVRLVRRGLAHDLGCLVDLERARGRRRPRSRAGSRARCTISASMSGDPSARSAASRARFVARSRSRCP